MQWCFVKPDCQLQTVVNGLWEVLYFRGLSALLAEPLLFLIADSCYWTFSNGTSVFRVYRIALLTQLSVLLRVVSSLQEVVYFR